MSDEISDAETDETLRMVRAVEAIKTSPLPFDRDLQIRDAGEKGLGLVWANEGELWAIVPDPFYTKDFLFRLKSMCNRMRRAKSIITEVSQ